MELPIFLLRKALGLTQQQMADRLGCGYSTLQGYEGGRNMSPEIRAAAIKLAHEHRLENVAQLLAGSPTDGIRKPGEYNPENRRWHDILEDILESKDPQALQAVQPNLLLFHAWVKHQKKRKSPQRS